MKSKKPKATKTTPSAFALETVLADFDAAREACKRRPNPKTGAALEAARTLLLVVLLRQAKADGRTRSQFAMTAEARRKEWDALPDLIEAHERVVDAITAYEKKPSRELDRERQVAEALLSNAERNHRDDLRAAKWLSETRVKYAERAPFWEGAGDSEADEAARRVLAQAADWADFEARSDVRRAVNLDAADAVLERAILARLVTKARARGARGRCTMKRPLMDQIKQAGVEAARAKGE